MDVFILNTGVVDFRSSEFAFVEQLVGPGGLAKCKTEDMPAYTDSQYKEWIAAGHATAGGPGNTAPLLAKAGFNVAVGINLGKGDQNGLDVPGRFFYDTMIQNSIDMTQTRIHPTLPTGTTFIYEKSSKERGGLAYFPNSNNDFDFAAFSRSVQTLKPAIIYYMYSGLSDRGDANGGRDLAAFIKYCRSLGSLTIADSPTFAANPQQVIDANIEVPQYRLLEPLLPELDLFFASYDEARMIENTLGEKGCSLGIPENDYIVHFLNFMAQRFWHQNNHPRLFGVTVRDGAFVIYRDAAGHITAPAKITSRYMCGNVVDLVGAGDSFRAGVTAYLCKHMDAFKTSQVNIEQAVQMGNLFASLYIKSPLNRRYENIGSYDKMLSIIESKAALNDCEALKAAVKGNG